MSNLKEYLSKGWQLLDKSTNFQTIKISFMNVKGYKKLTHINDGDFYYLLGYNDKTMLQHSKQVMNKLITKHILK